MGKDILVILMMAFGLFAILMFILFYAYLKRYYNNAHAVDDYEKIEEDNESDTEDEIEANNLTKEESKESTVTIDVKEDDGEFIPIKKK